MKTIRSLSASLFAIGVLALASCSKSNDSLAAFQPEINNITDNFQLQATQTKNVTTTLYYDWNNTGVKSNIDKSGAISSGTAQITLYDANNTQVYTSDLKVKGSEQSTTGVAGKWKIKVDLTNVNGDLNFRVQKGG